MLNNCKNKRIKIHWVYNKGMQVKIKVEILEQKIKVKIIYNKVKGSNKQIILIRVQIN